MKKICSFLIAMLSIAIFTSCDTNEIEPITDLEQIQSKGQIETLNAKNSKTVTVPFEANFYTKKDPSFTGEFDCPEGSGVNHQVGKGKGTHLGTFDAVMSFCGRADFTYGDGLGTFVAANGDELWYEIVAGIVIPIYDDPFYEAYFEDPFTFIGGTGRFEGATGGGFTYSFVDLFIDGWSPIPEDFIEEHRTDHVWAGKLTFKPGSRSN